MIALVARLITLALRAASARGLVAIGSGAVLADFINLDWLRQQSIKIAPGSDPQAIEEAARTAARLLGLSGDEVLWPTHTRGAMAGEPIVPKYLTIDLSRGRAWYSTRHVSFKALRRARGFGARRGFRSGQRSIATISQAQRG